MRRLVTRWITRRHFCDICARCWISWLTDPQPLHRSWLALPPTTGGRVLSDSLQHLGDSTEPESLPPRGRKLTRSSSRRWQIAKVCARGHQR
jgi:hypothetical protein